MITDYIGGEGSAETPKNDYVIYGWPLTTQIVFSMKANVMKERQRPQSGDGVQGWGKEGLTAAYDKGERGGDKRGMGGRRGRRGEAPVAQQQVDKDCSVWMRTTFAFFVSNRAQLAQVEMQSRHRRPSDFVRTFAHDRWRASPCFRWM